MPILIPRTHIALMDEPRKFLVRDDFTGNIAAGSINNTSATPGRGVRAAVETDGTLSTSGNLDFTAQATPTWGDLGLYYPDVITRAQGVALLAEFNLSTWEEMGIGLHTAAAIVDPDAMEHAIQANTTDGRLDINGGLQVMDGLAVNTNYQLCIVLAAAGCDFLIYNGTGWKRAWETDIGATASLYAQFSNLDAVGFIRFIRSMTMVGPWSSAYRDALGFATFTAANGTALSAYTPERGPILGGGANWDIQTNKARNSPVAGGNIPDDPGLETWTDANTLTNWSKAVAGTTTLNREGTIKHGGTYAARFDVDASNNLGQIGGAMLVAAGVWVQVAFWGYASASGKTVGFTLDGRAGITRDPGTTWTQYTETLRMNNANQPVNFKRVSAASASIYFDDVSVKPLTLSDLISGADYGYSDVLVNADLAVAAGTQAGVVACLDSLATPANFLLAWHNGVNARLAKCVAGVYTDLIDTAATYVANAPIRIIKDGTMVDLFYNHVKIGASQSVSDVGIISNTIHGIFDTYAVGNTIDAFEVWPRDIIRSAKAELERWTR